MNPVLATLLIPFLGTTLGAAFVFLMKRDMPALTQKILLGFASGVMVAASVWSLIIPAIDMGEGPYAVVPPTIGLLAGFAFLLIIDYITPHIHISGEAEGPQSRLSRTARCDLGGFQSGRRPGSRPGNRDPEYPGRSDCVNAFARCRKLSLEIILPGDIERNRGTDRRRSSIVFGDIHSGHHALYAGVRSRSHALCGSRRTGPGVFPGRALQYRHDWFRTRICPDDGTGCGAGINSLQEFFQLLNVR